MLLGHAGKRTPQASRDNVCVCAALVLPYPGAHAGVTLPPFLSLQDGQQVVMKTMTRTKLTDKDRQEVRPLLLYHTKCCIPNIWDWRLV